MNCKKLSRRDFLRFAGKAFLGTLAFGLGMPMPTYATENPFSFRTPNITLPELPLRSMTDSVVIHHVGGNDMDASAEEINQWHLNQGWAGIGYHFVIRKNGLIEYGRPLDAQGAHVEGDNEHTVGILVDGSFIHSYPTTEQYASLMYIVAGVLYHYGLDARAGRTIFGHCDFLSTACPGSYLYATIPHVADGASEYLSMWRG